MGKHYSDRERLEAVKKYRRSGKSASAFALEEGYSRSTFKDWVSAYEHLQGEFIRIDNMEETGGTVINEENVKMNVLKDDEVTKTSNHFSRFDHSVVVIETKQHSPSPNVRARIKSARKVMFMCIRAVIMTGRSPFMIFTNRGRSIKRRAG